MKKLCTLVLALTVLFSAFATVVEPPKKAADIMLPIGHTGQKISLLDLSQISVKEFQMLTGKKMKLTEKIGFKLAQRDLRKSINHDGTVNSKKLTKMLSKPVDGSGFHIGGFALGFLLGLIGVLIAYLINDDNKSQRVKWAWLGLAAWLVILLIILVV